MDIESIRRYFDAQRLSEFGPHGHKLSNIRFRTNVKTGLAQLGF
jgi:hypothetical protein